MSLRLLESDAARFARSLAEARGYHARASQFTHDGQRPSLVFNVAAMAVEGYMVALCAYHRQMPAHHSYTHMAREAADLMTLDAALVADVAALDRIFGLCSVDHYHHGDPDAADAAHALSVCDRLSPVLAALDTGALAS
ncbi:MAG: hypothetical protein QM639_18855 [Rhodocyclaceae bacterium]